jgi:dihydrofolate reductase
MSTLIYDLSMSLDGFVTGPNRRPGAELGDGGEKLHGWAFDETDVVGREVINRDIGETGAIICGRTTYNDSIQYWGADGPTGADRTPVIVVTHKPPPDAPGDSVYAFVTTGIVDALAQARAAARGRNIALAAGPNLANQFLRAGLVDEVWIHLAPVLFGEGLRLTEAMPAPIDLALIEDLAGAGAIHLRYRVVKPASAAVRHDVLDDVRFAVA